MTRKSETRRAGVDLARVLRAMFGKKDSELSYAEYLLTPGWRDRRMAAIVRAGRRCTKCGDWRQLNVHHLNYKNLGHEPPEDLVVLCKYCHAREHGRLDPELDEYHRVYVQERIARERGWPGGASPTDENMDEVLGRVAASMTLGVNTCTADE